MKVFLRLRSYLLTNDFSNFRNMNIFLPEKKIKKIWETFVKKFPSVTEKIKKTVVKTWDDVPCVDFHEMA